MSRGLLLLVLLVLVAPVAGAASLATPRCTQFYCFSFYDGDGDGLNEGFRGGTSTSVHEAPTVNAGGDAHGGYVTCEGLVGHEDEEGSYVAECIVTHERHGANVSSLDVYVALHEFDGTTGRLSPVAQPWIAFSDSDGDGQVDTATVHNLP